MKKISLSKTQLSELQNKELTLLKEIDRICDKYNIKYTLAYGTLLGAVREHGFIPWDDDVDICMLRDDYEKFKCVCKNELSDNFFYQSHETDQEYFHLFDKIRINNTIFKETFLYTYNIHHGVFIDIFPLDTVPDSKVLAKLQYIKFHFFRTGLMAKYLVLDARNGKKKIFAKLLRILYFPFSKEYLYMKANSIASKYKKGTYVHNFYNSVGLHDTFDKDYFYNLKRTKFENEEFSIPQEYDIILKNIYGEYMQRPPESQRKTTHDLVEFKL